jgi:hypothetical protein
VARRILAYSREGEFNRIRTKICLRRGLNHLLDYSAGAQYVRIVMLGMNANNQIPTISPGTNTKVTDPSIERASSCMLLPIPSSES